MNLREWERECTAFHRELADEREGATAALRAQCTREQWEAAGTALDATLLIGAVEQDLLVGRLLRELPQHTATILAVTGYELVAGRPQMQPYFRVA